MSLKVKQSARGRKLHKACSLPGTEISQWLLSVQKWCLSKQDVDGMDKGERLCLICLDRNVLDVACDKNDPKRAIDVLRFFRHNIVTYTNHKAPFGYLSGESLGTSHASLQPFVFEVNYNPPYAWYPLSNDGTLPVFDPQMLPYFRNRLHSGQRPKPWSNFSNETLVGWRGPMLPLSRIESLPPLLKKVWFDPEWSEIGVTCVSWGPALSTLGSLKVTPLTTHVLERQCASAKRARIPKKWLLKEQSKQPKKKARGKVESEARSEWPGEERAKASLLLRVDRAKASNRNHSTRNKASKK